MRQLLSSLERSLSLLNAVADGITAQDKTGHLIYVNDAAARLSGYPSGEAMLAAPMSEIAAQYEMLDEAGNPFDYAQLPGRLVLMGQPASECIMRYRFRKTGEERWSVVKAQPVYAENGEVEFAVNIFRDVTVQKKQEILQQFLIEAGKTLAASLDYETTLASVARLATPKIADWCAIDLIDEQQNIHRVAVAHVDPEKVAWAYELQRQYPPSLERETGFAKVIKTGQSDYFPKFTDEILVSAVAQDTELLKIMRQLDFRSSVVVPLTARGRTFGAITLVTTGDSGRYLSPDDVALAEELGRTAALAVDNARLYRQTQSERERFEVTLSSIGDAVIATNIEGIIELVNPIAEKMTGWKQTEAVGKSIDDVFKIVTSETPGTPHTLENGVEELTDNPYTQMIKRDGQKLSVEHNLSPIKNAAGDAAGSVLVFRDVSERRKAEEVLKKYALDLKRSNEELERFAYVASHDLQEPLRMVTLYLQLLEHRYKESLEQDAREFIAFAVDGAARMKTLIDDILIYSRVKTSEYNFVPFSSEKALKTALKNLKVKIEENQAKIVYENLPTIKGDENQFMQLFQNLLSNAIKFHGDHPPEIRVSAIRKRNEWLFAVHDNGIGIEEQYLERIFVMFKRLHTKEKYPGTGIGLAVCRKVIEHHQGRIWAESKSGEGTTFYFTVPTE